VRLLLDEHFSKLIAGQLRELGHDVVSVTERPELSGLNDHEVLSAMTRERRMLVTENWADFHREIRRAEADGLDHCGVLFTSARQLPRSRGTVGLFVRVLDDFLVRHPAEDALVNNYRWIPEPALRRARSRGTVSRPGRGSQ
jgi:hypothetical protein